MDSNPKTLTHRFDVKLARKGRGIRVMALFEVWIRQQGWPEIKRRQGCTQSQAGTVRRFVISVSPLFVKDGLDESESHRLTDRLNPPLVFSCRRVCSR